MTINLDLLDDESATEAIKTVGKLLTQTWLIGHWSAVGRWRFMEATGIQKTLVLSQITFAAGK
jgi:hypothetical protein